MTHTCETMPDTSDVQCGKPATLEVDYLAPPPPAADGKVHTHYYCSMAHMTLDGEALWGVGHDRESGVREIR
jgi:hypothetical protein